MPNRVPDTYPITGMCVVADANKCPAGYELLYRSHDKDEDCDLWKDSWYRSKIMRYLCFTRNYSSKGKTDVLADIAIQPDHEIPPPGYTLLEKTQDSGEKATRKKQICVRMLPRSSTQDAINEVIILSRNKRPPAGYTMAGEMNGLCICYKMTPVPAESISSYAESDTSSVDSVPYANPPPSSFSIHPHPYTNWAAMSRSHPAGALAFRDPNTGPAEHRGNSSLIYDRAATAAPVMSSQISNNQQNALADVPFQLHPSYQRAAQDNSLGVPEISYRSLVDLTNEYDYNFCTEHQARQRIPLK